jgi:hypothetical protein
MRASWTRKVYSGDPVKEASLWSSSMMNKELGDDMVSSSSYGRSNSSQLKHRHCKHEESHICNIVFTH